MKDDKEAINAKLRPYLTDEELAQFWENYDGSNLSGLSPQDAISMAFVWRNTPEGLEYWDHICIRVGAGILASRETTTAPTVAELIDAIRQWGIDKGITGPDGKGTLLGQLGKTQEELIETRDAAVLYVNGYDFMRNKKGELVKTKDELKDGLGDDAVTLILAAEMAGLRFEDCLAAAYEVISKRTGRMENGQFVKDT